ncbi:hypothetical protein GQ457_17G013490 [Hibiscus cannabinus]
MTMSETLTSLPNPTDGVPAPSYGIPPGRSPEVVLPLAASIALERPASPTTLAEQTVQKKGSRIGPTVFDDTMVVDVDHIEEGDKVTDLVQGEHNSVRAEDDPKPSYASKVAIGQQSSAKANPSYFGEEVVVCPKDVLVDKSGSIPSIRFSDQVHDQVDNCMRNALIVRLLGKLIGFKALHSRIHALWKPVGTLQLIDIDKNYYVVRFSDVNDYTRVLTEGPWMIYGSYLTVQPWSRSFLTSEAYPSQVLVWVRLPGLPLRYYTKAMFRCIADVLGRVVKIDYNTQEGGQGKFARLALLVDLNKPLCSCINIDGRLQKLEYEGLRQVCFECGIYGHGKENCPSVSAKVGDNEAKETTIPSTDKGKATAETDNGLFGPWMLVLEEVEDVDVRGKMGENNGVRSKNISVSAPAAPSVPSTVVSCPLNTAYLASNPPKKSNLNLSKGLVAVPLVTGTNVLVEDHIPKIVKGNHQAVKVVEENSRQLASSSSRRKGSVGGIGQIQKDVKNRGLRVRTPRVSQLGGLVGLADWANEFANNLDSVPGVNRSHDRHSDVHNRTIVLNSEDDISPSDSQWDEMEEEDTPHSA